ncbi:hypothetical protein POG22_02885 [Geitlerinema sp. CS-897]|nr:hypothetical protein [Geitlerinema sp. CS-897]
MIQAILNIIIVASSTLLLVSYLVIQKKQSDIKKGKIPKVLQQFPTHTSSQEEYTKTRLKIENFSSYCLEHQQSILQLNQSEINTVYTQGINLNKYKPGKYFYYEIQNDRIMEYMIRWPAFGPAFTLCYFEKKEIWYSSQGKVLEHQNLLGTQENSLTKKEIQLPIQYSALIVFIFGGSISPDGFTDFSKTVQYQKAEKILKRLKKIEVKNGILIIESQGN